MDLDLVSIKVASELLRAHPNTLRRHESSDGQWCEVYGCRLRIYRLGQTGKRRYDRNEILNILEQTKNGKKQEP